MSTAEKGVPAVRRATTDVKVTTLRGGRAGQRPDVVATEEPMEIRVAGPNQKPVPVTVTMRTPGNDFELAAGLLHNEGIISSKDQVKAICYCADVIDAEQRFNVVTVELFETYLETHRNRSFISTSACGVCGTTSIEELSTRTCVVDSDLKVDPQLLVALPHSMRPHQKVFEKTGGLHGAGIFDSTGRLEVTREDIGRHNALDKVIGHYFLENKLPLRDKILVLSGRIGFELVQKAAVAQIPIIVAVSAPSSLAIQTAESLGITIVGFVRKDGANIYSHPERVKL